MLDAKIFEKILVSNEVSYVNPLCDKNNSEVNDLEIPQDLIPKSKDQRIAIESFCNAPFHFEIVTWTQIQVQDVYQHYSYTFPNTPQILRDNFYPPPKVA